MKIVVVGAGGWGTALASILVEKHREVALYVRNPELAATLRRERENVPYRRVCRCQSICRSRIISRRRWPR